MRVSSQAAGIARVIVAISASGRMTSVDCRINLVQHAAVVRASCSSVVRVAGEAAGV